MGASSSISQPTGSILAYENKQKKSQEKGQKKKPWELPLVNLGIAPLDPLFLERKGYDANFDHQIKFINDFLENKSKGPSTDFSELRNLLVEEFGERSFLDNKAWLQIYLRKLDQSSAECKHKRRSSMKRLFTAQRIGRLFSQTGHPSGKGQHTFTSAQTTSSFVASNVSTKLPNVPTSRKPVPFLKPHIGRTASEEEMVDIYQKFLHLLRQNEKALGCDFHTFHRQYDMVKLLGRGAFGECKLYKQKTHDTHVPSHQANADKSYHVVVKSFFMQVPTRCHANIHRSIDRLSISAEIYLLSNLRHPHILQFMDSFASDADDGLQRNMHMTMEFADAGSLGHLIDTALAEATENNDVWICKNSKHSYGKLSDDIGSYGWDESSDSDISVQGEFELMSRQRKVEKQSSFRSSRRFVPGHGLGEEYSMKLFRQLLSALAYLHNRKILHRDVKPLNLLLFTDPSQSDDSLPSILKIADFGISRFTPGYNDLEQKTVIGTPYYLAPEIARGEDYDYASDIWAAGVVLYEMLTLQKAFDAKNYAAVIFQIVNFGAHEDPKSGPDTSQWSSRAEKPKEEVERIIKIILQSNPKKRPSAAELYAMTFTDNVSNEGFILEKLSLSSLKTGSGSFCGGPRTIADLLQCLEDLEQECRSPPIATRSRFLVWQQQWLDQLNMLRHVSTKSCNDGGLGAGSCWKISWRNFGKNQSIENF